MQAPAAAAIAILICSENLKLLQCLGYGSRKSLHSVKGTIPTPYFSPRQSMRFTKPQDTLPIPQSKLHRMLTAILSSIKLWQTMKCRLVKKIGWGYRITEHLSPGSTKETMLPRDCSAVRFQFERLLELWSMFVWYLPALMWDVVEVAALLLTSGYGVHDLALETGAAQACCKALFSQSRRRCSIT